MSFFTSLQYSSLTGQSLFGLNTVYLDFKLQQLDIQLQSLTLQNFGTTIVSQSQVTKVAQCGQKKWLFGGYMQKPIISYKERGNSTWIVMMEGSDFEFIYPDFTTNINNQAVQNPVVGVDFSCLSCRCECQDLKVEGDKRWSNGLPDDLRLLYISAIENLIDNDPKSKNTVAGSSCSEYTVKSESDHSTSVTYYINEDLIKQNQASLKNGFNDVLFTPIFSKYLRYNFNFNTRF
jgi:hypothetical protein